MALQDELITLGIKVDLDNQSLKNQALVVRHLLSKGISREAINVKKILDKVELTTTEVKKSFNNATDSAGRGFDKLQSKIESLNKKLKKNSITNKQFKKSLSQIFKAGSRASYQQELAGTLASRYKTQLNAKGKQSLSGLQANKYKQLIVGDQFADLIKNKNNRVVPQKADGVGYSNRYITGLSGKEKQLLGGYKGNLTRFGTDPYKRKSIQSNFLERIQRRIFNQEKKYLNNKSSANKANLEGLKKLQSILNNEISNNNKAIRDKEANDRRLKSIQEREIRRREVENRRLKAIQDREIRAKELALKRERALALKSSQKSALDRRRFGGEFFQSNKLGGRSIPVKFLKEGIKTERRLKKRLAQEIHKKETNLLRVRDRLKTQQSIKLYSIEKSNLEKLYSLRKSLSNKDSRGDNRNRGTNVSFTAGGVIKAYTIGAITSRIYGSIYSIFEGIKDNIEGRALLRSSLGGDLSSDKAYNKLAEIAEEVKIPIKSMASLVARLNLTSEKITPRSQELNTKFSKNLLLTAKIQGVTEENLNRVILQLQQTQSKGKFYAQESKSLLEHLGLSVNIAAQSRGISISDYRKLLLGDNSTSGGSFTYEDFARDITSEKSSKILTSLLDNRIVTIDEQFQVLGNTIERFGNVLNNQYGKSLNDVFGAFNKLAKTILDSDITINLFKDLMSKIVSGLNYLNKFISDKGNQEILVKIGTSILGFFTGKAFTNTILGGIKEVFGKISNLISGDIKGTILSLIPSLVGGGLGGYAGFQYGDKISNDNLSLYNRGDYDKLGKRYRGVSSLLDQKPFSVGQRRLTPVDHLKREGYIDAVNASQGTSFNGYGATISYLESQKEEIGGYYNKLFSSIIKNEIKSFKQLLISKTDIDISKINLKGFKDFTPEQIKDIYNDPSIQKRIKDLTNRGLISGKSNKLGGQTKTILFTRLLDEQLDKLTQSHESGGGLGDFLSDFGKAFESVLPSIESTLNSFSSFYKSNYAKLAEEDERYFNKYKKIQIKLAEFRLATGVIAGISNIIGEKNLGLQIAKGVALTASSVAGYAELQQLKNTEFSSNSGGSNFNISNYTVKSRATGGTVKAGNMYKTNEFGQEYFSNGSGTYMIPRTNGHISTEKQMGIGNGGVNISFSPIIEITSKDGTKTTHEGTNKIDIDSLSVKIENNISERIARGKSSLGQQLVR